MGAGRSYGGVRLQSENKYSRRMPQEKRLTPEFRFPSGRKRLGEVALSPATCELLAHGVPTKHMSGYLQDDGKDLLLRNREALGGIVPSSRDTHA